MSAPDNSKNKNKNSNKKDLSNGKGKLKVGLSLSKSETLEEKEMPDQSWINADSTTFSVRVGPNYKSNKKKEPSLQSIYECVAVDLYSSEKKIGNIGRLLDLPGDHTPDETNGYLPGTIVINVQVPGYPVENMVWGRNPEDGQGYSLIFYFCPSAFGIEQLKSRRGADAESGKVDGTCWTPRDDDAVCPAISLLNRFVNAEKDSELRQRFKAITRMVNVDSAGMGVATQKLVRSYNGTPFLIRTCSVFFKGDNYFEVDVDVHRFSYLARMGLSGVRERIKDVIFDFSFVIEGHTDQELPEQMLGAVRLSKLNLSQATPFPQEFIPQDP